MGTGTKTKQKKKKRKKRKEKWVKNKGKKKKRRESLTLSSVEPATGDCVLSSASIYWTTILFQELTLFVQDGGFYTLNKYIFTDDSRVKTLMERCKIRHMVRESFEVTRGN